MMHALRHVRLAALTLLVAGVFALAAVALAAGHPQGRRLLALWPLGALAPLPSSPLPQDAFARVAEPDHPWLPPSPGVPPRERVLVVITAQLRSTELTWPSFERHLLDPLGADLALCIGFGHSPALHRDPFYLRAKYIWTYYEPPAGDYAVALDFAAAREGASNVSAWRAMAGLSPIGEPLTAWFRGSFAIQIFFRWYLHHMLTRSGVHRLYDRFIVTRSDNFYGMPHPPLSAMDPRYIWIPFGEDRGGISDRHFVIPQASKGCRRGRICGMCVCWERGFIRHPRDSRGPACVAPQIWPELGL